MTAAANDRFPSLGPATEARFLAAFSAGALITAKAAYEDVLGLDESTFSALVDAGAIRHVLVGRSTKRYTEADLRAYLMGETQLCPSTSQRKAASGNTTSSYKAAGFTARPGRLRVVQQKPPSAA